MSVYVTMIDKCELLKPEWINDAFISFQSNNIIYSNDEYLVMNVYVSVISYMLPVKIENNAQWGT